MVQDPVDELLTEIIRQHTGRFLRAGVPPDEAERLARNAVSIRAQEVLRRRRPQE